MTIALLTTPPNTVQRRLANHAFLIDATLPWQVCTKTLGDLQPDILVTYRCPHIIPASLLDTIPLAVNIHPSLLPAYAGCNPWGDMIDAHETKGGVTLHRLTPNVDQGEILFQYPFSLDFSQGFNTMRQLADQVAAEILQDYLLIYCNRNNNDTSIKGYYAQN